MRDMWYAGVDVGTSGCKMLVYDLTGSIVFQVSRQYRETGTAGTRELDPYVVIRSLLEVFRAAGTACGAKIRALAVASLGESVVCMDAERKILGKSLVTGDPRGAGEAEELIRQKGRTEIFKITGLPPNELYSLPKLMWMDRSTDAIRNAKYIMFYEDLVGYLLTGARKVSYTSAARSLAFDVQKKEWSEELLAMAGIHREQMSEPVPPLTVIGTLLPEMAQRTGLDPAMKVIVGGHDQTCAAIGSGLMDMQTGECGIGTCEFMFMRMKAPRMDEAMIEHDFTCIPYVQQSSYLTSLEVTTCGILKNWARETILAKAEQESCRAGVDYYEYIERLAKESQTDVMVLPQFGSSGNPDLDMNTRGTITGLTIHTRLEEIYRAILESFALQLKLSYDRLEALDVVAMRRIIATGGGARSELTLQIMADVFNMEVITLENEEAGTLGCAIMAAVADAALPELQYAMERMVRYRRHFYPQPEAVRYYHGKMEQYRILYEKMHRAF